MARMLFGMHNENPRLEKDLISILKPLEPKLDLFSYFSPDPEHIFLFLEDEKGNRFGTRSFSDGTLRFLAMSCVVLTAQQGAEDNALSPVIIIEEPENGLYVGHLKPLIERINAVGKHGQFVFTSHSPYFMDLFDAHLEGLHLIKTEGRVSKLVSVDTKKIRDLMNEMSLGEMHFRELLA